MSKQVYIWDRFVRLFHWSLVVLFIISLVSGEQEHWIHSYSGYAIFTLISLRIIWGFVGSKHARFKDFVRSPFAVLSYLKSMVSGSPQRYLGHNPAGGAMILGLLATLFLTTLSGMKLYAIEEGKGPFAQTTSTSIVSQTYASDYEYEAEQYEGEEHEGEKYESHEYEESEEEEFWEDIHETAVSLMLLLILLHVIGVVISSRQHKELLVKSMMTGYKEDHINK